MADEATTQPRTPLKEAASILWLAQHDFRAESDYKIFCDAVRNIPWDFTDERFLAQIEELKQRMMPRLELDNEENLKKVAEEVRSNTISKDELEVMDEGLEEAQGQRSAHHKKAHGFAESAVDNYIKNLKEARGADVTPEQESSIRNSADQAVQKSLDTGDVSHIKNTLSSLINTQVEIPPEIQDSVSKAPGLSRITEVVLTSGDDVQKGTLVELCLANPDADPRIIADKNGGELQAAKIFALSEDVRTNIESELDDPNMRKAAFEQAVAGGAQGISKPANDILTAVGGPQGKEFISDVIDTVIGSSVKEAKEAGAVAGIKITPTVWTNEKISRLEQSLGKRNAARQASKMFFDNALVSSAATMWEPQIQEGFRVYLESATVKVHGLAPEYFHYFVIAGTNVWNTILGGSTKQVAGQAVKKASAALLEKGGEKAAAAAGATAVKAVGGGIFGGPIGTFLVLAGDKIVSFVGGAIKGFFSFLQFGEISKGITGGIGDPQKPKTWREDHGLVLALLCVGGLLFCMGMTFTRETATTAAIVAEKEEGGSSSENTLGRGPSHRPSVRDERLEAAVAREKGVRREKKPLVNFAADPKNAVWIQSLKESVDPTLFVISSDPNIPPVVTQVPGEDFTHGDLNAVDIRAPLQSLALSPVNGTVTNVVDLYADGSGYAGSTDGGGYGNYIEITTQEGYVLRVAHLAFNSMPPKNTIVSIGDVIGRSGQTGFSTGPHFHYELIGAGNLNIMELFK